MGGVAWWLAAAAVPRAAAAPGERPPARPDSAAVQRPAVPAVVDTALGPLTPLPGIGRDTLSTAGRPTWQRHKSPRRAMYASFLVPGLGQLYNERPFWSVVAAGFEFYFIGNWVVEQRLTNRYRAIYNADPSNTNAQVFLELHRDNRIQAQWLLGLTVALSAIQAYVDAALADFDDSPLPLQVGPDLGPDRAGLVLRVRF